jgi:hypothetical protein
MSALKKVCVTLVRVLFSPERSGEQEDLSGSRKLLLNRSPKPAIRSVLRAPFFNLWVIIFLKFYLFSGFSSIWFLSIPSAQYFKRIPLVFLTHTYNISSIYVVMLTKHAKFGPNNDQFCPKMSICAKMGRNGVVKCLQCGIMSISFSEFDLTS